MILLLEQASRSSKPKMEAIGVLPPPLVLLPLFSSVVPPHIPASPDRFTELPPDFDFVEDIDDDGTAPEGTIVGYPNTGNHTDKRRY
jgi:hypothetical protein